MCDVCKDILDLVESYDGRNARNEAKPSILSKAEIETVYRYMEASKDKLCMCLYRDAKNFERFNLVVQSMLSLTIHHLKHIERFIADYKRLSMNTAQTASGQALYSGVDNIGTTSANDKSTTEEDDVTVGKSGKALKESKDETRETIALASEPASSVALSPKATAIQAQQQHCTEETWILPEVERLLFLVPKLFLLNFPLYMACEHGTPSSIVVSAEEAQYLNIFCNARHREIPVYLLRNTTLFCTSGGFAAMMLCFEQTNLPVTTANAIMKALSNITLWLNGGCILQLFMPLRSRILQYICKLSDQNLRYISINTVNTFLATSARNCFGNRVAFDVERLIVLFKYLTSTSLTFRLYAMTTISVYINNIPYIKETESVVEKEIVRKQISSWLSENQILQHLFGPNLHVKVIKNSWVVLHFLAVENQITEEHIELIWQATQLNHCSKVIFKFLLSLVKYMEPRPALHLHSLLCRMDPRKYTEQHRSIASTLKKIIWSRHSSHSQMMQNQ